MLKDALEHLQHLAVRASTTEVLDISLDPQTKYLVLDGKLEEISLDPPPRSGAVATVEDLWTMTECLLAAGCQTEIWVGEAQITLLHAAADRRDRTRVRLLQSRQHAYLAQMGAAEKYVQQSLVRMLRFELGASLETILPFRRIVWTAKGASQQTAAASAAAFGKQIEQEVTGTDPLPEVVRLDVPLWDTPAEKLKHRIELGVEYNHGDQTISIAPLPGQLEAARTAHQQDIYARLCALAAARAHHLAELADPDDDAREGTVTIFRGDP